jgi:hypothetical protein
MRRSKGAKCLAGLGAVLLPVVPLAAMPVSEFVPVAKRMEKAGITGIFSGDRKFVTDEMKRVIGGFRPRNDARGDDHALRSCPPPKGKAKFDPEDFITYLKAIPPAQQNIDMTVAFDRYMRKKYPC